MVKMVLLLLTFLMHLYSPQQGRLPRYSTSLCGTSNIRKANYISMICHYCASGVNGSILYDAKHASALAADEIVECKIIQGKESLSAIRKIP